MGGWRELDFRVVELEGLASEQLRHALSDQLIAEAFGVAEVRPAVQLSLVTLLVLEYQWFLVYQLYPAYLWFLEYH